MTRIILDIEEDINDKMCARRRIVVGNEEVILLDEHDLYELGLRFKEFGKYLIKKYR